MRGRRRAGLFGAGAALAALALLATAVPAAAAPDSARPPRTVIDSLRVAEDLADLGLEDEALEEYRDILRRARGREDLKRAWYGVARCELMRKRFEQAFETYRDIAARYPEEAKAVAFLMLRYHRDRWQWKECLDLLGSLEGRGDLLEGERGEVRSLLGWVGRQLELRPVVEERFSGRLGPEWFLASPLRARVSAARGDIEVRFGAEPGRAGAAALVTPVPWQGEPCAFAADLKVIDMEPGAIVRIGLAAGAPKGPRTGDRLYVELASPEEPAGEATGGRYRAGLVAVAGDARVERSMQPGEAGLAIEVWYRVRVEYVPALARARIEVTERAGLEAAAGAARPGGGFEAARPASQGGRARTVFQAELALPRSFGADAYFFGALSPADEPEGAPATLALDEARLRVASEAAAGPLPPAGMSAADEATMRGNAALASGSPADALAFYRTATAADPFLDGAIFGTGLAARESGDLIAAARAFAAVVRTEPRAREEFRRVADELAAHGSPLDLFSVLEDFLVIDPTDTARRAAYDVARRHVIESLDTELETEGGFGLADRLRRARLYLRCGEPDRALAELERAGRPEPPAELLVLRAECYVAKKEVARAAIDYHRAVSLAPDNPEPLIGIAWLLLEQDYHGVPEDPPEAAAEALLTRANRLAPKRADVLRLRANARYKIGRLADARADADQAIALEPRDPYAYAVKATIALKEGRRDEAKALVDLAGRLGPVDPALTAAVSGPR